MGEVLPARFWCHMCADFINPIMEAEIKCPFCDGGFVEEMNGEDIETASELRSDRALSLWAPILMGMVSSRNSRFRSEEEEEADSDRELDDFISRARSSAMLQLIQSIRGDREGDRRGRDRERTRERRRGRSAIIMDSLNEAIFLQGGSLGSDDNSRDSPSPFGNYFIESGFDLLLQHLAENDPNRYGTPPAKKEAVEALPTVKVDEVMSCSVCLDDFVKGSAAKEMPCRHKFHKDCILPWLELHSSCPVCRFQLPADGSKDSNVSNDGRRVGGNSSEDGADEGGIRGNSNRGYIPGLWPFNGLFSQSGSRNGGNSSSNPSSSSSTYGHNSNAEEN